MARILFLTTKQPSTNPRMRKSADALAKAGHEVHVLYAFNTEWATEADQSIFRSEVWSHERVGGHPISERITYQWARAWRKFFEITGNTERAICRGFARYVERGIDWKPDLVIGHNPGALGPLIRISKGLNVPALFDAEDYHRGEAARQESATTSITKLEDSLLPDLTRMTAASPMIAQAYRKLYPALSVTTVNNAFPLDCLSPKPTASKENPLSMVWFSQVIGLDRGLEEFLTCLQLIPTIPVAINLVGLASDDVKSRVNKLDLSPNQNIRFHSPMPEKDLFEFISNQEIGLALEPGFSRNNDWARSNKIYTYPLAGCYTLASKTAAQVQFMEEFPQAGELVDLNDPESMANALKELHENRSVLLEKRIQAWELAKTTLNWELESQTLLSLVDDILGS